MLNNILGKYSIAGDVRFLNLDEIRSKIYMLQIELMNDIDKRGD